MHDFSQWLQSADGMDEKVCVFLVFGALFCAIAAFISQLPRRQASRLGRECGSCDSPLREVVTGAPSIMGG